MPAKKTIDWTLALKNYKKLDILKEGSCKSREQVLLPWGNKYKRGKGSAYMRVRVE